MNARNVNNYTNNGAAEALEQALQTFEPTWQRFE